MVRRTVFFISNLLIALSMGLFEGSTQEMLSLSHLINPRANSVVRGHWILAEEDEFLLSIISMNSVQCLLQFHEFLDSQKQNIRTSCAFLEKANDHFQCYLQNCMFLEYELSSILLKEYWLPDGKYMWSVVIDNFQI